ncbi:MAG: glycosyltransferase family 2 protein [Bacteroidota bacterium]
MEKFNLLVENKKDLKGVLPLISIITIVYNGAKYIERTINSVINQTYHNIEFIIIDGGSTDQTLDIIKKYEDKITFWKSEPDLGIADAFNKGISVAKGSIIGFVNSDDWYEDDTIEKVVGYFDSYSVVFGDVQFWEKNKKTHRTYGDHNRLHHGMTIAHPAVFVKKEIYNKYGLFNLEYKIAMDYEFILRLYFNKVSFYNIESILVNMSLGGLSDRKWLEACIEERKIKGLYIGKIWSYYCFIKQFSIFFVRNVIKFLKIK